MSPMIKLEKIIISIAQRTNWIAAISIILMVLLTTADVISRIFRLFHTRTYELVGFFSAFAISFHWDTLHWRRGIFRWISSCSVFPKSCVI